MGTSVLSTSTDVDGVSYNFILKDFQLTASSTPLTYGLPIDGVINSVITSTPGLSYQLASYSGNNSLRLAATNDTGTILFTTPKAATQLYMLSTSGSGTSTITIVINFTDGTNQTLTGASISDWYNGSGFAVQGFGRINRTSDALDSAGGTNPRLYQRAIPIDAANQTKLIESVTITKTGGVGLPNIFAFSVDAYFFCVAPVLQTPNNFTANSADVSWSSVSNGATYDVYHSTSNVTPASSVTPTYPAVAGLSTTIGGLNPNTTYYYWVRTNCSSGGTTQSYWSFVGTFKTLCGPMTDMSENFDSYATGSIVPDCWVRNAGSGSMSISSASPLSGTRNIYQYVTSSGTPSTVVLPEFSNINAGTHWLRLNARVSSGTGTLKVGYVTNATDPSTFVLLQTLNITNTNYTNSEHDIIVPTTVPANARLAVQNTADGRSYYWDDVRWEVLPTCFKPMSPALTVATLSGATIEWTAPNPAPANGYEVYYSTSNVAPTASTVLDASNSVTSTTTSVIINGLPSDVNYFAWVRSSCSASDKSEWSNVVSFRTGYCSVSSNSQGSWVAAFSSTGASTNMAYTSTSGGTGGYRNLTDGNNKISNIAGSVTPISLTAGGPTCGIAVWIDWNNNLIFESSEKMFVTSSYVTTTSGSITVPAGTAAGNYRMRVLVHYNNSVPSNPCEAAITRGEYIDFLFEVTSGLSTSEISQYKNNIQAYPNPFADVLNISDVKNVKSISVMDLSGKLVKSIEKPTVNLHLGDLSSGAYLVVLNMNDGSKKTIKAMRK